jgi:CRP-like cAMP-binding protein
MSQRTKPTGNAPPVLPGVHANVETPIDIALSLTLAGEREAALRWAAAILKADPAMPSALVVTGRLLGELGRQETAREACRIALARAVDFENLPLAVAAARELERFGGDAKPELERIADAFCRGSSRLGEGSLPPPPMTLGKDFQPLPSVLTGLMLVNKATEAVHEAKRALAEVELSPGIAAQPLFSQIGAEGLRSLCAGMEPVWVSSDTAVIQEGDMGAEAFFVARGELEVRRARGSEVLVLAQLQSGALFGEMALLSRTSRAASVVATRPSIVLRATKAALDEVARAYPEVGQELALHCRARLVQNLVKVSELLRVLPKPERAVLIDRCVTRTYERGETLFAVGERADGLHLIAAGEVRVVRRDEEGEPLVLATLGPGDVVGEVALVFRRPVSADATAVLPVVTLFFSAEALLATLAEHPRVLAELYKIAVRRDEETSSILAEEALLADDFVLV